MSERVLATLPCTGGLLLGRGKQFGFCCCLKRLKDCFICKPCDIRLAPHVMDQASEGKVKEHQGMGAEALAARGGAA